MKKIITVDSWNKNMLKQVSVFVAFAAIAQSAQIGHFDVYPQTGKSTDPAVTDPVVTDPGDGFSCAGKLNMFYPNPNDCRQYYECEFGELTE